MKPLQYKKYPTHGFCHVKYCHKRTKGRKLCSTHRSQKCRQADPVKAAFNALRNNAKRRDILFTITLDQFRDWCVKVSYIGHKGRAATSYTVDRIHNDIGYHIDNIKVLTKSENVKKYFSYDYRSGTAVVTAAPVIVESGPF